MASHLAGWAGLLLAGAALWAIASRVPAFRPLRAPIAAGFAVRAAAALVHVYVVPLPDSRGDAVGFEALAWEWAADGFVPALGRFEAGAFMYSWFGALLYSLTTRSPLMLASANVFAGALAAAVTGVLAGRLGGERAARWACWAAALFPASVLYSAVTLREAWIVLFLVYGTFCAARFQRGEGRRWLARALVALVVGGGLNSGVLAAAAVVTLEAVLHAARRIPARGAARGAIVAGGALCVAAGVAALAQGWSGENLVWMMHPEKFGKAQHAFSAGRTAYLEGFYVDSPWDLLWQTPVRVPVFLFGSPWWPRHALDVLAALDGLLYVVLSLLIVSRGRALARDRAGRGVLGVLAAVTLLFALFTGNFGTALRHRAKVAPLAIALAAAAWAGAGRPVHPGRGPPV